MLNASDMIRRIIKKSPTNQKLLAELMGINKKTLDSRFYRDNFEANDLLKIIDVLDLKMVIVNDEGKTIFDTADYKRMD
jgi:hypothetical protein